jgi:nucleotide-binding universal stress UspA family protein
MAQEGHPAQHREVVVGFDGSRQATVAVDWAAGEAARRGARLRILVAVPTEYVGSAAPVGFSARLVPKSSEGPAKEQLEDVKRQAAKRLTEDAIDLAVVRRRPTPALLAASEQTELLVLGSRGRGAVTSTIMGSVSTAVAEHAACPVVVVRGAVEESERPRAITVGVDGSDMALAAVAFAADMAARREVPLRILCAWTLMSLGRHWGYAYATETSVDEWARPMVEAARRAVDTAAEQARTAHHGLVVHTETPEMEPGLALEEASRNSDLVVVGARGANVLERAVRGSVSRTVLHHAACPVAVVRH